MEEAEAVDYGLHEAIIDALGNEIISNAYRVNWIKIRLIRLEETRPTCRLIPPVMGEHLAHHRGDRGARSDRRAAADRGAHHRSRNRALGSRPDH